MSTASPCTVVLAAQLHATDGRRRDDAASLRLLRDAAQAFGAGRPGALAEAASTAAGGALVLHLTLGSALPDALLALTAFLRPSRPTFSAVVGERATDARRGAAVERALAGLAHADPRGPRVAVLITEEEDPVLGALLDLILGAHDAMTDRQRHVVALVRESGSQQAVARHLNVSRQAVNQSLAAAGWRRLSRAESVARARLAQAAREAPVRGSVS